MQRHVGKEQYWCNITAKDPDFVFFPARTQINWILDPNFLSFFLFRAYRNTFKIRKPYEITFLCFFMLSFNADVHAMIALNC